MNKNTIFKRGKVFYHLPSKLIGEIVEEKIEKRLTGDFITFRLFQQIYPFQANVANLKPKQTELSFDDVSCDVYYALDYIEPLR